MKNKPPHLVERPPIVAVLGHVDHGKSTLLDFIRKSDTVAQEAGGITQHVAAYEVEHQISRSSKLEARSSKKITFIDTPGHAAFAAIRARGATVADIAILVVAADDGVKAQTLEALQQIRDANIPLIVAINKIDKPNADQERTIRTLLEHEVYLEKYGGDVPWAAISAKTGAGVPELLDLVLLVAEIADIKADSSHPASGYVIETHRDQKRGIAATLVITSGTLKSGMAVLAGRAVSPVRIMENHAGRGVKEASFSSPVSLIGFDELPEVGVEFKAFKTKREAENARPAAAPAHAATPAAQPAPEQENAPFLMPIIIRADTTGSLEAIAHETAKIGGADRRISIVQSGIGSVSEGDVKAALAGATAAHVIGFNVGADPIAEALARERGVAVETFDIIYKLTEHLEELLASATPKRAVETTIGRAKVLKRFSSRKDEHVVGGKVSDGYLAKNARVRVLRRGVSVGAGKIINIQTNKQNTERAEAPGEFGAQIEAPFEIAEGDLLECFIVEMK